MKKILLVLILGSIFFSYAHEECDQATIDSGVELYGAYERAKEALPEHEAYRKAKAEHARYRDDIVRVIETTPEGRAVLREHMVIPTSTGAEEEIPKYLGILLDRGYPEIEGYVGRLEKYRQTRDAYYADRDNNSKKEAYERALAEHNRFANVIGAIMEATPEGRAALESNVSIPDSKVLEEELPRELAERLDRGPYPEMEDYLLKREEYEKASIAYYEAHHALPEQQAWERFVETNENSCSMEKVKEDHYTRKIRRIKAGFVSSEGRKRRTLKSSRSGSGKGVQ